MKAMTEGRANDATLRLRSDTLQWREIEGEVIALDQDAATYLATNAAATLLWRALSEGTTRAELIAALTEKFDIDDERAAADIDDFLQALRSRNLLSG